VVCSSPKGIAVGLPRSRVCQGGGLHEPSGIQAGLTASEILLQLSLYGERTVPRLCRDLQLEVDVAEGFAMALARRGMVALGQTDRGHMKIALASVGQEALQEYQLSERRAG